MIIAFGTVFFIGTSMASAEQLHWVQHFNLVGVPPQLQGAADVGAGGQAGPRLL